MKRNNIDCIMLCAGKGTRMQSKDTHKVCFDIAGKPAVIQAMQRYEKAGIENYTIVVGPMAEQVMGAVSSGYDDVSFAYQKRALGTGNAAKVGYKALRGRSSGNLLVTMGDKIVDPSVISMMIDEFEEKQADLVIAVVPKEQNKSGGHMVVKNGRVMGIIESLDINKAKLYKKVLESADGKDILLDPEEDIRRISKDIISSEKKRAKVLLQMESITTMMKAGDVKGAKRLLKASSAISLGGGEFDPGELEKCEYVNAAVYLFKKDAFEYGIGLMGNDNADGEEYLTEAINHICSSGEYVVSMVDFPDPKAILTYNNVVELLKVREILTGREDECKLGLDRYMPIGQWIDLFEKMPGSLRKNLVEIYGDDEKAIEERRRVYLKALNLFVEKYGRDRKAVICRAPGRVNLMGRHVEHRGGNVNVISINREVICVASPNRGSINICNTDGAYEDRSFSIEEHFKDVDWSDWLGYLDSEEITDMVTKSRGDWMNYVKAPVIRLQYLYRDKKLTGMDMAFSGNIPVAAGLSSSSAIVVATAEAAVALNNLDITPQKFVDLCGEGEWFVGSRGGAGDHAAMKFGQRGYIASLGFFPFGYRGAVEFPAGYKLLIANSGIKANKTTNARDLFNRRIASYEFGLMMIKDKFPYYRGKLKHLRDVNPENLEIPPSGIYSILLELPERISSDEVYDLISEGFRNMQMKDFSISFIWQLLLNLTAG